MGSEEGRGKKMKTRIRSSRCFSSFGREMEVRGYDVKLCTTSLGSGTRRSLWPRPGRLEQWLEVHHQSLLPDPAFFPHEPSPHRCQLW